MRVALVLAFLVGLTAVVHAKPAVHAQAQAQPSALIVVIDRSLPADKLAAVTKALSDAIDGFDPAEQLAVISTGKTATVEVPLQSTSNTNKKRITARLAGLRHTGTGDLIAGLRAVSSLPQPNGLPRRVVVVTDGNELIEIGPIAAKLHARGDTVSALGYQSLNRVTLREIADGGGGKLYLADDAKTMIKAFSRVAEPVVLPQDIAVVFVIDRSASMSGSNLEAAKEVVRAMTEMLTSTDMVAAVAFDSEAQVFVSPQHAANRLQITADTARLQPTGVGTNIYPGLKEAFKILQGIDGFSKRVIVLSDGGAPTDGIAELVQDMHAAQITVSVVGFPSGDRDVLQLIAQAGAGRLYMLEDLGPLLREMRTELAISPLAETAQK